MADVTLKYVGNGAFFVGIPTTDLPSDSYTPTAEEVEMLVRSGLYERVTPPMSVAIEETPQPQPQPQPRRGKEPAP